MKAAIGCLVGLVFGISASAEPLLEGRVRLESGQPVADAQVQLFDLTNLRQGAIARAMTDGRGYFALPLAAPTGQARPARFELGPNYPNPFNPSTNIPYQLAALSEVRLEVFNLLGQRIAMLVDGERPAGFHTATWHATDAAGRAVAAGVYIYRMTVGVESQTGRMVLVDGQAGVSAAGAASVLSGVSGGGSDGAESEVYGLIVSGEGLAPYVDSSFRVEAGMAPVELVVSSGHSGGKAADDDCAFCDLFDALNDEEEGPGPSGKAQAALEAPPAPTNLRFDAPTDSSCRVRWDAAAGATDYDVNYRPAVGGRWTNEPHRGIGLSNTIDDLQPNTEYRWAVRAENSDGTSEWIHGTNFTTRPSSEDDGLSDAPSPPTNLRFDAPTDSSCTVRWDASDGATDYDVNYKPAVGGRWTIEPHRGIGLSNTIDDLQPNTEYRWAVRAENSEGTSEWIHGPNFTTLPEEGPDLIVQSPSVSAVVLTPGQAFTLQVTVHNQGDEQAAATMLHYYRSNNSTITASDTEVGTDAIDALDASATSAESISLTAPSDVGTYYYGACVERKSGESAGNNCSAAVSITVAAVTPPSAGGANKLYWTDWGTDKIQRSNLDGSGVEDLVTTGLVSPVGLALDVSGGKLYWTDGVTEKIQRSNLDGSGIEDLVTTGLDFPVGLALDVSGGKLYWTDVGTDKIQRSNLDGSGIEDLVTTGLENPVGLALDVSGGKLYWTDWATAKIQRSNLDGSGIEDLVTTGLDFPVGLALDVSGGKLYWTDVDTEKIQRSNLDGSGVEDLVTTGLDVPVGLALDVSGGKLYWTDFGTDKIQRSNLDGSGVEDLVTTGLENPEGIALGFVPVEVGPDLTVEASVSDNRPTPGQSFELSVTVRNRGTEQAATTLRYYRSDDATIDATDTPVGTAAVNSLDSLAPRAYSIDLLAPESTGTYYYGACVESVSGESNTDNNCSSAVTVTVGQAPEPDDQAGACFVGQVLSPGQSCTLNDIPGINVGSNTFRVTSEGRGCVGGICAGTGLNLNDFSATKSGDTWTIVSLP